MHKQYTPQEMADRCLIIREVQNVVGKIAQCDLLADYDLVPQFWSSREDICLGMNNGYFKGAEAAEAGEHQEAHGPGYGKMGGSSQRQGQDRR